LNAFLGSFLRPAQQLAMRRSFATAITQHGLSKQALNRDRSKVL
jgi:hypothetical protein